MIFLPIATGMPPLPSDSKEKPMKAEMHTETVNHPLNRDLAEIRELDSHETEAVSGGNLIAVGIVLAMGVAAASAAAEGYLAYETAWYAKR
jgi:hypothetical protein